MIRTPLRRTLGAVAALGLAGGGALAVAAPASAATTYTVEPCQNGTYTVLDGDTVRFVYSPQDWTNGCGGGVSGVTMVDKFAGDGGNHCEVWRFGPSGSIAITDPVRSTLLSITTAGTATLGGAVSVSWAPCGGDEPPAGEPIIVHQSVGLPTSGSCSAIADPALGGDTGLEGGWTRSWEEWPNDGKGGAVCTRTLVNDGSWHLQGE